MSGAEVFAVFGALSSILQVVDFTGKVASHAHDIFIAKQDATKGNAEAKSLALQYEHLGQKLHSLSIDPADITPEEQTVKDLGKQCHDKAQGLLRQLEKLSISSYKTGAKRLAGGTVKAVKATTQRKDISRQRQDLQELNSQLATAILRTLLEKQRALPKAAQQIIDAVEKSTEDAVTKALSVMKGEKKVRRRTREILAHLSFPAMHTRSKSIAQAYDSTYCWALESTALEFRTWLREGSGTFWITGKAGSGKSTLMKFLSEQHNTSTLLEHWSGSKQLIFASYYFWYAGSSLQKSTEGLLRTILHRILRQASALIPIAFEEWYPQSTARTPRPLQGLTESEGFTQSELMTAFNRIARHGSAHCDKKFCLFIDGLDEYSGNHGELVTLLNGLIKNTDIKICVSSRPWNAFCAAYATKVPSMRLEDLTRDDIWKYVDGKVTSAAMTYGQASTASSAVVASLVMDITTRAEGVFLWVILVVKSVLIGIAEGDDIPFLQHRVQAFPADLDEFFSDMLKRADSVYRPQTYQALKYAWLVVVHGLESSIVDYWLIGNDPKGLPDPIFAFNLDVSSLTSVSRDVIRSQTVRFLSASCKDLLQVHGDGVDFLHRTVYDFLSTHQMQSTFDTSAPSHFKSVSVSNQMAVACLKAEWYWSFNDVQDRSISLMRFLNLVGKFSTQMSAKYVAECENTLLRALQELCEKKKTFPLRDGHTDQLLRIVIALQHYRLVKKYLMELEWPSLRNSEPHHNKDLVRSLLGAAIGGSHYGIPPIEQVNVDFIRYLLDRARQWKECRAHTTVVCDRGCSRFAWQLLLRRWFLATRSGKLQDTRNVWEAAKLFLGDLDSKTRLGTFCIQSHRDEQDHEHVWVDADQFFVNKVPPEWLLEMA